MEKLLWIGSLESDLEFKDKSEKGFNLASAQVSQKNLIRGIEEVTGLIFDTINGSVLPPYPDYKDKFIAEKKWVHKKNGSNISVGYKNVKLINRITCEKAMIQAAKNWIKERYQGEELSIFVYSMRSSVMAAAYEIKKKIPEAKMYLIVTDLPQFMDLNQNKIKTILKKIDWLQIKRMQKFFDGFILYAPKMAEFLKIQNDKWLLMEGSYDSTELFPVKKTKNSKKIIMYSGMIEKKYGLELLVEAFKIINDSNTELWITGGGSDIEYIKNCASLDSRIKFYGFLASRNEVLVMQQEATVLMNMRLPSEPASSYCFPSKLFEYMASGTLVLSLKLDGVPEEYYNYLAIIEQESAESIAKAIKETLEMSVYEKNNTERAAREYILRNKNLITQSKKICSWANLKAVGNK